MKSLPNIQKLLRSSCEETRRGALQALRDRDLSETSDLFFLAMGDESWRVRKEAVDIYVAANPDEAAIDMLLELLRNEDNAGLRNSAAEAASRIGNRASKPLMRMIKDKDEDVRKLVIDIMGTIGNSEFVPMLLASLRDPDVNVASAAAEHLGNIGDEGAIPDLVKAIIDNDSVFFRFSALAALGKFTSHIPVPNEIIQLADQSILQKSVYDCLGSIGDEAVIPVLLQGCLSSQKSSRNSAIISWYKIFSRSTGTIRLKLHKDLLVQTEIDLVPVLIESFDLQNLPLSEAIITLLGLTGDIRGAKTLLNAFSCERISGSVLASLKRLGTAGIGTLIELYPGCDENGRYAICTIIEQLNCTDSDDTIKRALQDSSNLVKLAALKAAVKLRLTDLIPEIIKLLDEGNSQLRSDIISSLRGFAAFDRVAIQDVARRLRESEYPEQRCEAVILIAALGDSESLALLMKDENPTVRQAAITAVGKQRIVCASSKLFMALVDEDPDVRIAAAEAIGIVCGPEAIPYLVLALNDKDCWVQCESLRSIARLDKTQLVSAIQVVFFDAKGLLLKTCLELLESVGSRDAMDMIETALNSEDCEVVSLSMSILVRQGGEWVLSNAERLISHPCIEVRSAWAGILASLPPSQAKLYLSYALKQENDPNVKSVIKRFMDEIE